VHITITLTVLDDLSHLLWYWGTRWKYLT